jgi:hypothetical protein
MTHVMNRWFALGFAGIVSLGAIDLFGEITGGGAYDELLPHSVQIGVFGVRCSFLDLEKLIQVKRAAGRIDSSSVSSLRFAKKSWPHAAALK